LQGLGVFFTDKYIANDAAMLSPYHLCKAYPIADSYTSGIPLVVRPFHAATTHAHNGSDSRVIEPCQCHAAYFSSSSLHAPYLLIVYTICTDRSITNSIY